MGLTRNFLFCVGVILVAIPIVVAVIMLPQIDSSID